MDAKEVEDEPAHCHERLDQPIALARRPQRSQPIHPTPCLVTGFDGHEPNLASAVRIPLDDGLGTFLVSARIPHRSACDSVNLLNRFWSHIERIALGMG